MFTNACRKKGESLIEVLVALSIFMLIFSGVVTMIAGSVTLNLSARQRTVAVAKVQKYLNEYLAGTSSGDSCSAAPRTVGTKIVNIGVINGYSNLNCGNPGNLKTSGDYCYWIEIQGLATIERPLGYTSGPGITPSNFVKIISHGKWYARPLGELEFDVSRVVRNN